jgi:phage terminase large subunit-like protein
MTAVEWLVEQMKLDELFNADYFIEQAKEMEEEQIENAFNYGQFDLGMEADEYYNLIYKSE